MVRRWGWLMLVMGALVLVGAGATASSDGPGGGGGGGGGGDKAADETTPPKNLEVLPKDMPRKDVNALMKTFNKSLGVKCGFCHNTKDYASDEKDHKKISRNMMKMTLEIQKNWFTEEKGPNVKFNCFMCHHGHDEPKLSP